MWRPAISPAALDEGFLKTRRARPRGVSILSPPEHDEVDPPDPLLKPISSGVRMRHEGALRPFVAEPSLEPEHEQKQVLHASSELNDLMNRVKKLENNRTALAIWTGVGVLLLTTGLLVFVVVRTR